MVSRNSIWERLSDFAGKHVSKPRLGDIFARAGHAYRRRYHRHELPPLNLASVQILDKTYQVVNLGFGGMKIDGLGLNGLTLSMRNQHVLLVGFTFFGFFQRLPVRIMALTATTSGLRFENLQMNEESFIENFLYFMDAGLRLKAIAKSQVRPTYQNPAWHSYGDSQGMIEVHVQLGPSREVAEAHIYYRGTQKQEITQLTSKNINVSATHKRDLSHRERCEILLHALCILIGLRQVGKTDRLDALLKDAAQFLEMQLKKNQ